MTWMIRVCAHGHRVEYRENYGGWLHMDADSDVCKSAEPPGVVCVTTDSEAVGTGGGRHVLLGDHLFDNPCVSRWRDGEVS